MSDLTPLSKRTYRQLSKNWDFNLENSDVDTLVANELNGLSQRRSVKLEKKIISKICRIVDLAKS
jgi:hypothetical protein